MEHSLPGAKVPGSESSMELSLPGAKVPRSESSSYRIMEAGHRPLFSALSKIKIHKAQINSSVKLFYTSFHKWLSSE